MKKILLLILLLYSQIGFSQTKSEIDTLLNRICNEVKNSKSIINNKNAKKIIEYGENSYDVLDEFLDVKIKTQIYSDCKEDNLTFGGVTRIILNHIILEQRNLRKKNKLFLKNATKIEIIELLKNNCWENKEKGKIIKFWFENDKGNLTEYEKDEKGELLVIDAHPFVEIVKKRKRYLLKFVSLNAHWKSKIIYLSETKLILKTDRKWIEYKNIKID